MFCDGLIGLRAACPLVLVKLLFLFIFNILLIQGKVRMSAQLGHESRPTELGRDKSGIRAVRSSECLQTVSSRVLFMV